MEVFDIIPSSMQIETIMRIAKAYTRNIKKDVYSSCERFGE